MTTTIEDMDLPVKVNVDALTLGEIEQFEEISGVSISSIGKSGATASALIALSFLSISRIYPDVTIDEVRRLKMTDIEFDDGGDITDPK